MNIWIESNKIYGAPKIKFLLKKQYNINIGFSKLYDLMHRNNIKCLYHKKFKPYPKNKHIKANRKNLINRKFTTKNPNVLWFTDITYIKTINGFCYLNVIIDSFDKSIVSWQLSKSIDTKLATNTLKDAKCKHYNSSPIIHSDQGVQYTSGEYQETMQNFNFTSSFSSPGCPYDNAVVESFFSYFKKELIYSLSDKLTFKELYKKISEYIYFYNNKRIHSSLGYKTPKQFFDLYKSSIQVV